MTYKHLRKYLEQNNLTYKQYLASPHWQDVRRRFWKSKLHNRTCQACGANDCPLDVHHKTYSRIGREKLNDLCLVCRDCHQAAHELANGTKYRTLWQTVRRVRLNLRQTGDRKVMLKGKAARDWKLAQK